MPNTSPFKTESGAAAFHIGFYPKSTTSGLPNYYSGFRSSVDTDAFGSETTTALYPYDYLYGGGTEVATDVPANGTDPSGATVTYEVPSPEYVHITNEAQFQDAKVTVQRDQFEHKTQLSSKAIKFLITGIEVMAEVSIASITMDQIAMLFSTVVLDDGAATPGNFNIQVKDSSGQDLWGNCMRILPYDGNSVTSDSKQYITMPNAAPIDINNTDLTYGLETQRALRITFYSLPFYLWDPDSESFSDTHKINGARVIFGNLTNEPTAGANAAVYDAT